MVGRTLEMWDAFGTKPNFSPEQPWMFQPSDKITFYEVSLEEYEAAAAEFFAGRYQWQVSESTFDVRQIYESFDAATKDQGIIEYKKLQQECLAEQEQLEKLLYEEWAQNAAAASQSHAANDAEDATAYLNNPGILAITSPMAANVWKVEVKVGDIIKEGQIVAILEAMKMEVNVLAPKGSGDFVVKSILKKPKSTANAGDVIAIVEKKK
jgi:biotin carboxyl carrier protein